MMKSTRGSFRSYFSGSKLLTCLGLSFLVSCSSALTSLAQETPANAGKDNNSAPLTTQGGAQTFELNLEKLRDVGLDLKNILKDASSLYDEVTVRAVTIITQPQMVASGSIVLRPVATQPVGPPSPPKKERVDLAMANLRPVVTLMKRDVDDFIACDRQLNLPKEISSKLEPYLNEWVTAVGNMSTQVTKLDQLTPGPKYDNKAIAALAVDLQNETRALDKIRRAVYKILQKEGKRERKKKK